jgi:hypothetical protein
MNNREQSPSRRFDTLWKAATFGGEDIGTLDEVGSITARTISTKDGTETKAIVRAHHEPHVVGSLRPNMRTLEVVNVDGKVASLTDGQVVFLPQSEQVIQALTTLEKILPPNK